MTWTKINPNFSPTIQDPDGVAIANTKVILDYNLDQNSRPRYAALLQVDDYSNGTGDDITINPSDASSTTWTEGVDFSASTDNDTTAENIANNAINSTTNYYASPVTGIDSDPYVYVVYQGGGYIVSATSGDASAWSFYEINSNNGTIAQVASNDSGTIKDQPFFSDSNGYVIAFVDAPALIDVEYVKSQESFNNANRETINVPLPSDGTGNLSANGAVLTQYIGMGERKRPPCGVI